MESLRATASVESFVLAVDTEEALGGGFLGGTAAGREFWRGLRGGGDAGARAFQAHCKKEIDAIADAFIDFDAGATPAPAPKLSASIKAEVYSNFRNALRYVISVKITVRPY